MSEFIDKLLVRAQADQKVRNDTLAGRIKWDESVDADNTEYLHGIIDDHGWPRQSIVGQEASRAVWLLAQHADRDPAFQARCLSLMKTLPENEINPAHIAYLEDRVSVNYGQSQLYGTQFYEEGEFFGPRPIEDRENLDVRRMAVGLEPFNDYEAKMLEIHKNKTIKNRG